MTHVLQRQIHHSYPIAVGGDGAYVLDRAGKRYLDASGGAAVSCLGHSHAEVAGAIKAQIDRLAFAHTSFFINEPAEELAEWLAERAPGDLNFVYFVSGGSEATETAMKLAHQFHRENGEPDRSVFIARRQSYHGNTLGALALSGNPMRRAVFEPLLVSNVQHVSACYAYREQGDDESEVDYVNRLGRELEEAIEQAGAGRVAAFVAETVSGATLGAAVPAPGYFKRMREICDRHGILLILDEVMCGMGRTGTLFACEQDGVVPDILTCAKSLGAGYQPIGATMLSQKIYEAIAAGSGAFQHGFTYIGHAAACAGALAVQRVIARDRLLENVRRQGDALRDDLTAAFGQHPHVGDIRGRGLFIGLELVAEREAKIPFDPARRLHSRVKAAAMEAGLMCYPTGGTVDGTHGDHVLLAPPFILEDAQRVEIVEKLATAIDTAIDVGSG